jgi:hypothetical protein
VHIERTHSAYNARKTMGVAPLLMNLTNIVQRRIESGWCVSATTSTTTVVLVVVHPQDHGGACGGASTTTTVALVVVHPHPHVRNVLSVKQGELKISSSFVN